jgi:hypothetical protein
VYFYTVQGGARNLIVFSFLYVLRREVSLCQPGIGHSPTVIPVSIRPRAWSVFVQSGQQMTVRVKNVDTGFLYALRRGVSLYWRGVEVWLRITPEVSIRPRA